MTREETENQSDDAMQIDHPVAAVEIFNPNHLKVYYGKLFPYADGKHPGCDQSYLSRREFSFTLENDMYLRYQSFNSMSKLQNSIRNKCPYKIDVGPVYRVDPAKRHAYAQTGGNNVFTPMEKELVFDIDISDYDDVRYCCSGADVCLKCWPLMTAAIKVIDSALRDDFGFNHILWVLVAGVVSTAGFAMEKLEGNENNNKISLVGPALHPFLVRAYSDVLKDIFEENLLINQDLFATEDMFVNVLYLVLDDAKSELRIKWKNNKRSSSDINSIRWGQFKNLLRSGKTKAQGLRRCVEEVVFTYTYPRLDMEVSKHMNHLLKAPFCVHPKTGKVCVPIDPYSSEEFDPTTVPTLSKLMEELNDRGPLTDAADDIESTSLRKSMNYLRLSFLPPLLKSCKDEIEKAHSAKIQESKNSMGW